MNTQQQLRREQAKGHFPQLPCRQHTVDGECTDQTEPVGSHWCSIARTLFALLG
jgi:hypothetical protein